MAGSEIKVNQISPKQTCTTITVGNSGNTIIIPAGATITNNGTATGFGPTGAISWSTTVRTTGFTAVSGNGYFCDTTSAGFIVTLPSSPSAGAIVAFKDYAKTWNTNNLTLGRNSSNIEGIAANAVQSTQGQAITLVYVDSTKGWVVTDSGLSSEAQVPQYIAATGGTVTTCGNYKIHTFTATGSFVVSCAGNSIGSNSVDYLVVAGGGSGSANYGGGGAGGFRYANSTFPVACSPASPLSNTTGIPVTATTYPITIGGGGTLTGCTTSPGNNSVFSTITSAGGGGAGTSPTPSPAMNGGSGGGGSTGTCGSTPLGGLGNTPPVSPPQGNNGGKGIQTGGVGDVGGGGGGSIAVGSNGAQPYQGGSGGAGAGLPTAFGSNGTTGPSPLYRYYAGGGGARNSPGGGPGAGGVGGGGNGLSPGRAQTAGTTNTGGGGGAGSGASSPLAAGGSGIVVIRYKYQ